jgi:hypothetical protein
MACKKMKVMVRNSTIKLYMLWQTKSSIGISTIGIVGVYPTFCTMGKGYTLSFPKVTMLHGNKRGTCNEL